MFVILAYLMVLLHFLFLLYVTFGGFLLLYYPSTLWLHVPSVIWGFLVQTMNWPCPLSTFERFFRRMGGMHVHKEDFFARYIVGTFYPNGITLRAQYVLGIAGVLVNVLIYWVVFSHAT